MYSTYTVPKGDPRPSWEVAYIIGCRTLPHTHHTLSLCVSATYVLLLRTQHSNPVSIIQRERGRERRGRGGEREREREEGGERRGREREEGGEEGGERERERRGERGGGREGEREGERRGGERRGEKFDKSN